MSVLMGLRTGVVMRPVGSAFNYEAFWDTEETVKCLQKLCVCLIFTCIYPF